MTLVSKLVRVVLLAALLIIPAASVFANPVTMPVDQIKVGMKGIAKTVVSGTRIEQFGVEVLGIMKDKGPSGDLILVKTYGDVIDRTGGIAQGMSGSPVYINGKLVGAIAYGWSFTDHRIGMVTPIGDMLKIWNVTTGKNNTTNNNSNNNEKLNTEATPLMAAGFSEGALDMLKTKLGPLNLIPYAVGGAPTGVSFGKLEPGSSIGLDLVRGDISLGALGTVTYVENNKVLAFGHPFIKKGISNYFMSSGYVFSVVNGMENAFKIGITGPALGVVNQDRGAGIAGEIGKIPSAIPLNITVQDLSTGKNRQADVQVIKDEQLSPILATASILSVIEKTIDRVGPGTAKVSFELSAHNMPGEIFKRDNMFYTAGNVNEVAVVEINELLSLMAANQFQSVDMYNLKVKVAVEEERRTAMIISARTDVQEANPGDKINIIVTLKPYRGQNITKTIPFTIPKDQFNGPLMLEVRGGGTIPLGELLKRQITEGEVLKLVNKLKTQTFNDLIKELAERDHNNDIVVEVMDVTGGYGAGDQSQAQPAGGQLEYSAGMGPETEKKQQPVAATNPEGKKADDKVKSFLSTDFIVDSDTQVAIEIKGGKQKPGDKTAGTELPATVQAHSLWH